MKINPICNENIIFHGKKFHKNKLLQPTNTNLQFALGPKNLEIMDRIRKTAQEKNREVYLFGGAVRDCLLRKPINDLDFIINGDALEFAKELKEKHGNLFKSIFLKPSVNRAVVYTDKMAVDLKPLTDDCKTITGKDNLRKSLIKVLLTNDFTVNNMAIKLDKDKSGNLKLRFLDYLKGKKDLEQNLLKYNQRSSFFENPILGLRGIRLGFQYGMKVNPATNEIINETIKNPKVKKNKFYFRYARECFRIVKEFFKKLF